MDGLGHVVEANAQQEHRRSVVFVDTTLGGPLIGGAQTFLPSLVVGLRSRGWRVTVVTEPGPPNELTDAMREAGAAIVADWWGRHELMEDVGPKLARRVRELAPDVYVVSVSPGEGWVALPLLEPCIKTAAIAHTDSETFYAPIRHYGALLTGAVGVSREISRKLEADCGLPPSRVHTQAYGVSCAAAKPAAVEAAGAPLRLMYAGRLEQPQKRIMDLVALVKALTARGVRFTLDLAGDGPEREAVAAGLREEVGRGIVRLRGWLSGRDVIEGLRRTDVFVLLSAYEGLPIALLEAMGNGAAPVVSDLASGHRELIRPGDNGFLIPVGDVAGFAEAIARLDGDRTLLQAIRRRAWETGSAYSVERMAANYAAMFEGMVASESASEAPRPAPGFPLMASCRSRYPRWLRRLKVAALKSVE